MQFSAAALVSACLAATTLAAPQPITRLNTFRKRDVASTLAPQLTSDAEITFPQDANWLHVAERWTLWHAPSFQVTIQPASEADVVAIVSVHTASPATHDSFLMWSFHRSTTPPPTTSPSLLNLAVMATLQS